MNLVDQKGFDLPCGAGRLGLQSATGTLPRALGFESRDDYKNKSPALRRDSYYWQMTLILIETVQGGAITV